MAAATWRLKGSEEVITAEAFAMLQMLRLARDCGFRHMEFDSDNEKIVHLVQNEKKENISYLGLILSEIRVLKSCFDTCHIKYISRSCNLVAHNIAQLAHSSLDTIWLEEVPLDVQEVYYHDLLIK